MAQLKGTFSRMNNKYLHLDMQWIFTASQTKIKSKSFQGGKSASPSKQWESDNVRTSH